jgi:hypothetical protein
MSKEISAANKQILFLGLVSSFVFAASTPNPENEINNSQANSGVPESTVNPGDKVSAKSKNKKHHNKIEKPQDNPVNTSNPRPLKVPVDPSDQRRSSSSSSPQGK